MDFAPTPSTLAQSKDRKGSNFDSGNLVLRALGLPLRLGGEDGSQITNKRAFALILLLPIALDVALVCGKGWVLYQGLPNTDEILELFKKKGLKNWDTFRDGMKIS